MTGPVPQTIFGSQYVQIGKNGIGAQLVDLLLILLQTAVPPGHSTGGRMNSFRIKTNCIVPGTRLYDTTRHCCSHTEDMAPKAGMCTLSPDYQCSSPTVLMHRQSPQVLRTQRHVTDGKPDTIHCQRSSISATNAAASLLSFISGSGQDHQAQLPILLLRVYLAVL